MTEASSCSINRMKCCVDCMEARGNQLAAGTAFLKHHTDELALTFAMKMADEMHVCVSWCLQVRLWNIQEQPGGMMAGGGASIMGTGVGEIKHTQPVLSVSWSSFRESRSSYESESILGRSRS